MAGRFVAGDLPAYYFDELSVGMSAEYRRPISDDDIPQFAAVSGDVHPLHLDDDFAPGTVFKGRVVHGRYTAAMIPTTIGPRMPGPGCMSVSRTLRCRAPVRPGDEVVARATIERLLPAKRRALFRTVCRVGETVVVDGEARIQVPGRPAAGAQAG